MNYPHPYDKNNKNVGNYRKLYPKSAMHDKSLLIPKTKNTA
jgi:hypothetical protein